MKIAFLNEKYLNHSTGGAHQSVRILAGSLVKKGHEACVWTTTYRADQEETTEVHEGIPVVHLPIANVYWPHGHRPGVLKPLWHAIDAFNPGMAASVGRLLDSEKPDVLHTNILASFSPSVWREARRRGVPVVHTLRDHYLMCPSGEMFTSKGNCERQCLVCAGYSAPKKFATRDVDAVVGISDFLLREHLERGYFSRTPLQRVIHNSYAPGIVPPSREPADADPDTRTGLRVGYLGRLFKTKGIELLIDAVTRGLDDSARLVIAGSGDPDYERSLRERCGSAASRVAFLGVVPPETLFQQIDVLAAPSLWREPFGRIVIEANAWGVPVVASRRGGLPEIVEDGVNGFLFEPHHDELAPLLRGLTPARCGAMRAACLARAREFLPETSAAQYETLYREVVERAQRTIRAQAASASSGVPASPVDSRRQTQTQP